MTPPPIPTSASSLERGVILIIALYASIKVVLIMAANEVGRIEGLGEKLFHRIWGTDDKSFYGVLLLPTVAAAKLVDVQRSPNFNEGDFNIGMKDEFHVGILIHMFMSKHVILHNMSILWAMTIVTGISVFLVISLSKFGFFPLFEKLPWQFILFSQIFYQVSLYSIITILKKSFTFGELSVVAQAITLLVVELWVITVNRFNLMSHSHFRKHSPSDITLYQIALILGMLLIGIILSPILIRSRHLAQQPRWRTKHAHAFNNGRKWTAFSIYGGTALIIGLIGHCMKFYLSTDPYSWIVNYIIESPMKIVLALYWIITIALSLLLFAKYAFSRKIYSLNTKRKFFHFLAIVMFIPGYLLEPDFMHLAFSVAFAALIYLEYLRYFAVYPLGKKLHIFLCEFLDYRDIGPCILSHIYLLVGCAGSNLSGILTLGIGDAMASIIGRRYGRHRWPGTSKTVEGSIAFILFQLFGAYIVTLICPSSNMWADGEKWVGYSFAVSITALLEAISYQNDNLMIPLYMWALEKEIVFRQTVNSNMDFLERLKIMAPEAAAVYNDLEVIEESTETILANTRRVEITLDNKNWQKKDTDEFYKIGKKFKSEQKKNPERFHDALTRNGEFIVYKNLFM
ncbi:1392_t:CDS:10 [Diversispora eburnea]|uniref:dolichol kinase n=1 Tax=Diversispora eburnea TaxID=1213867 RepID=A0A9N9AJ76_9GLOM|nr:1392_t:CDS:10 [Diversispora eburnea]